MTQIFCISHHNSIKPNATMHSFRLKSHITTLNLRMDEKWKLSDPRSNSFSDSSRCIRAGTKRVENSHRLSHLVIPLCLPSDDKCLRLSREWDDDPIHQAVQMPTYVLWSEWKRLIQSSHLPFAVLSVRTRSRSLGISASGKGGFWFNRRHTIRCHRDFFFGQ